MNAPLPVQYIHWIGKIVTKGDFGDSYTYNKPISQLIMDRIAYDLADSPDVSFRFYRGGHIARHLCRPPGNTVLPTRWSLFSPSSA